MHRMCCDAVMVLQTSLSSTPSIASMIMNSLPKALSVSELQERTRGTGIVVLSLTKADVSSENSDREIRHAYQIATLQAPS